MQPGHWDRGLRISATVRAVSKSSKLRMPAQQDRYPEQTETIPDPDVSEFSGHPRSEGPRCPDLAETGQLLARVSIPGTCAGFPVDLLGEVIESRSICAAKSL